MTPDLCIAASVIGVCLLTYLPMARINNHRWPWQKPILFGTRWAIRGGPTVEVQEMADNAGRVTVELPDGGTQRVYECDLRRCARQVIPSARDMGVKP